MLLFALLATSLLACKKDDIQQPVTKTNDVRFIIRPLPDTALPMPAGASLIVTLKNNTGAEVASNLKLSISHEGMYISEKLRLPDGVLSLTKFLITGPTGQVYFAAPVAGSAKAMQVQKPLALQVSVPKPTVTQLPVEVLAVGTDDLPQDFGYPAGTFQQQPAPAPVTFTVKLQAVVTIGSITYDSIPAQFRIISWDKNNIPHQKDTLLAAGVNQVSLPVSHTRFQFSMTKWGISDAVTLAKDEIDETLVYTLGGGKAPKKLRKEESFLYVSGDWQPSSRTIYSYNDKGLSMIDFYQKKPQQAELQFTHKHRYHYTGNNPVRIDVLNPDNTVSGFSKYEYNAQGTKIMNIRQVTPAIETAATVSYDYPQGYSAITIDYVFSNGNSMDYKMKIIGGNRVEDIGRTSVGGSESGRYQFDFNINPYAHMKMPNLYLSNISKNNLVGQQKSYAGAYPVAEPYRFEYVYDADGYPAELVKYFKNFQTGEHLYKIKTIYTY